MAVSKYYSLVSIILKSDCPYEILGVSRISGKKEIEKCYKWTMTRVHPDKNSHPLATKAAQKVNISRDILMNGNHTGKRLDAEMSEMCSNLSEELTKFFNNLAEELARFYNNLKCIVLLVPLIFCLWFIYFVKYLYAKEWNFEKTSFHRTEHTTYLYNVKYYTLSETSRTPDETEVLSEYFKLICASCREQFNKYPWHEALFSFANGDKCVEAKLIIIYMLMFAIFVRLVLFFSTRIRYLPTIVHVHN